MKVIVAPDSFKGCMSASQAAARIEKGLKAACPHWQVEKIPMADGGEGTAEVFASLLSLPMVSCCVQDAYGKNTAVKYVYDARQKTAILDAASIIGLNMVEKSKRNVMIASSKGVGQMMQDAISRGARKLIIGLGGSSTNDGGMGLLEAFGCVFYDGNRQILKCCPYSLSGIAFIDKRFFKVPRGIEIIVAADVKNYLLGEQGATYTYGRQKGLYGFQLSRVEDGMRHYRDKLQQTFHIDVNLFAGGGAAGGIGAVLLGIFHAQMRPGIELITEYANLKEKIANCDMVITGEGQSDAQTLYGKVPMGICRLAKEFKKPCVCLSGALADGYEGLFDQGMSGIFSTTGKVTTFEAALSQGPENLEKLAYSVAHLLKSFHL